MNYYNQHLTFKSSAAIIPKHQLQKGMIVQNRYKNLKGETKDYMFLILNPEIKGKVHVLNLNEFTSTRFNELARTTGVRIIPKESSQRFYYNKLAASMESLYNNSYRTLFINNMALVQLIDYKFDSDIEDMIDRKATQ